MKKPFFNPASCLASIILDISVRDFSHPDGEKLSVDAAKTSLIDIISQSAGYKGGADFHEFLKFAQQKDLSHLPTQLISLVKQIEDEVVQRYGHRHALAFQALSSKEVSLKVADHSSGNLTLMYKTPEMRLYNDAYGQSLFANNDPISFYESAIRFFEFLLAAGRKVTFENLSTLPKLEGILLPLPSDIKMNIRAWIHKLHIQNPELDQKIHKNNNKNIRENLLKNNLKFKEKIYPSNAPSIFSLYAEGILIPRVYFEEASLVGHSLLPFK
ncbi:hypothetical protein EO763_05280 [Pectobacterium odoriferum]|uniref:hypothetical protein n=1 Tax=Pectobacterium odoriferum TaxID=78398 RepID=UPI0013742F3B|nr:hypothetical protein [Pectobacterium odoriferum]QHP79399.1 hypothetical protein EO763_05280 [Pectobacterium odoriferum]